MSRIVRTLLLALGLCSLTAVAQQTVPPPMQKQGGHHTGTPAGKLGACSGPDMPGWTQAQKDERAALQRYHHGEQMVHEGKNQVSSGRQQESAGRARQRSDPKGQQGKQMEHNGQNLQKGGEQHMKDGEAKKSAAERDLQGIWRREIAEGSASVHKALGCGGPERPARM